MSKYDDDLSREPEYEEPDSPEEGDLATEDHRTFYTYQEGFRGVAFVVEDDAEMWDAIQAYMDRSQFWPNVWFISDHGNAHLMNRA